MQPTHARTRPLQLIDAELRSRFPEVSSITAQNLQDLLARKDKPILIDVRQAEEYAVSHIKGAIRVDPDAATSDVLRAVGPDVANRVVIFYCSVGVRSTELAERSRVELKASGAAQIANLTQGIFGWHNASRPLVRDDAPTAYVHPYNALWSRLVIHRSLTSYILVERGAQVKNVHFENRKWHLFLRSWG